MELFNIMSFLGESRQGDREEIGRSLGEDRYETGSTSARDVGGFTR
jgi:hypothetical protein